MPIGTRGGKEKQASLNGSQEMTLPDLLLAQSEAEKTVLPRHIPRSQKQCSGSGSLPKDVGAARDKEGKPTGIQGTCSQCGLRFTWSPGNPGPWNPQW